MNREKNLSKNLPALALLLLLLPGLSACGPTASATPAVQTVEVTQEVNRLVMQEVTREVTKIVEVPVTVTPAPTLEPTSTPDPNATGAPDLPQATLPEYTDCLYGPATFYVYKTSFPAGQQVEVVGRSQDAGWLNIEEVGGWNSCWIPAEKAQLQAGRVADLPVAKVILPRSEYEFGSPLTTSATRNGDEVTVSWEAVYMSADEIQGYLIEANVCQGGKLVHLPVFVGLTFEQNTGTLTTMIQDEAGCAEPSTAHIVSVGKRGFAEWEKIFWPAYP
jgi:hypothetical protein